MVAIGGIGSEIFLLITGLGVYTVLEVFGDRGQRDLTGATTRDL
jgi:hypothetical protein